MSATWLKGMRAAARRADQDGPDRIDGISPRFGVAYLKIEDICPPRRSWVAGLAADRRLDDGLNILDVEAVGGRSGPDRAGP